MIPVRILRKFYCEPWLIREDVHHAMGEALMDYLDGPRQREQAGFPSDPGPFAPSPEVLQGRGIRMDGGYVLVDVAGTIGKHLSMLEMMCADGYDLARLEQQLLAIGRRRELHTVVFRFNSAGGTAAGVGDVAAMIRDLGEDRRTIAYLDIEACSAAYWLAAGCREIYAPASATVGSIAAYIALLDQTKAYDKKGLAMQVFRDGALKGMGSRGHGWARMRKRFFKRGWRQLGGLSSGPCRLGGRGFPGRRWMGDG